MPMRRLRESLGGGQESVVIPRLYLPDHHGAALSPPEMLRVITDAINELCSGLNCSRLVALSYSNRDRVLRGIHAVGFDFEGVREYTVPLSGFSLAERSIVSTQILTIDSGRDLPMPLAQFFPGETVVAPLVLSGRPIAVLIGLAAQGASTRSSSWRERADQVLARGALVVELERTANAYFDEVGMRQARRVLGAAILENRPFEEICDLLLQIICQRLNVDRAGLYVRDFEGKYSVAAIRNISPEYTDRVMRLRKPGPVIARAVATGLPYHARNIQNDTQFEPEARALFKEEGVSSILIAALHHGETHMGALAVYPDADRVFTPAEISVFQSFADQATMAVAARDLMKQQRDIAIMEERNRLAREMHDTVAQSLAALVLQIETANSELNAGNLQLVRTLMESAVSQARKGLEDTRRAVKGLSPASLDSQSAGTAIAELTRSFEAEHGIPALFVMSGEEQPLQPEQSLALLRIAQEALNNAYKHASAKRVRVGLRYNQENVTLLVEDDGVGFEATPAPSPDGAAGYGLFGMNERVRLLDGELEIESTPGWGTRIQASLPYRLSSEVRSTITPTAPPAPVAVAASAPAALPAYALTKTSGIRILIVDDHAIMRQGIRGILESTGEVTVVAESADGAEAVTEAERVRPDVVLMDLQMPGVDGLEGLRRMQQVLPEIPVVVLTTFQTQESVTEALTAGARGFMLKDAEPSQLLQAIRAAHRGEALLAPSVTDRLAEMASGQNSRSDMEALNERELEVLEQLAQGARNKEIAERLFIVPRTVEYHLANIYSKLGVSNRTEAAREAINRGLVSQAPRGMK